MASYLIRVNLPCWPRPRPQDVFLTSDSYMSMEEGCTATLVLLEADAREGWVLQVG